jgi:hypothetical protein
VRAHPPREREAVHVAGQAHIGENGVDSRICLEDADCGRRVADLDHFEAAVAESIRDVQPDEELILDHQDCWHSGGNHTAALRARCSGLAAFQLAK